MLFHHRIHRTDRGDFQLQLPVAERELVASLTEELRSLLAERTGEAPPADPNLRRLFPTAYADDAELDAEYHSLVGADLRDGRLAALDTVASTIRADRLGEEQLLAWMGAVNDLRLVLGTRLDVTDDTDPRPPPGHPDETAYAVYQYLTQLLEEIVAALAD